MGMTLIQKILLKHSGLKALEDFIYANVDFCFANDITGPLAVREFEKAGFNKVFNNKKIGFICDHFTPAKDLKAANNVAFLKSFSQKHHLKHFYDINVAGIEHAFIPEQGLIKPGYLVIGADSHTCTYGAMGLASFGVGSTDLAACFYTGKCWFRVPETILFNYNGKLPKWTSAKDLILYTIGQIGVEGASYKVMQFAGSAINTLSMDGRFTMCNMAIEAGGKTGLIAADTVTERFCKERKIAIAKKDILTADSDASYERVYDFDVKAIEPQVAAPHLPSNVKPVSAFKKVAVNQVVIGSCTNGRIDDLKIAAQILKKKKIKTSVRTIIFPATYTIYKEALAKGYISTLEEAGCIISSPTCGPCLGGHSGILAKGETALATTNRNFIGRMGHTESFVYLSSPAVAAASAVTGKITHPEEVA